MLRAAEQVIAESGYEGATMCAIARRGGSAVGSLYQFFPNKDALADALRESFTKEYEEFWRVGRLGGQKLKVEPLTERLLAFPVAMAQRHPAFLPLLDLPPSRHSHRRHERMRRRIAAILRLGRPRLSRAQALRLAGVLRQVLKAFLTLYARATPTERERIVEEFKLLLAAYLHARLKE